MFPLRLPDELEARLEKLATSTHRTKSFYARQAIELHIEDLEDLYLAEKAYSDYKAARFPPVRLKTLPRNRGHKLHIANPVGPKYNYHQIVGLSHPEEGTSWWRR
jgi:RHH-type rel operon transcriptional repressor/antitoxin RelB